MIEDNILFNSYLNGLAQVRSIKSTSQSNQNTGWTGQGIGQVSTQWTEDGALLFREHGQWNTTKGDSFAFSNTYRWRITGRSIAIAHLRQGDNNPVFLTDLMGNGSTLSGSHPHLCNMDRYYATLSMKGDQFILIWRVQGPTKDELIRHVYQK